MSTDQDRADILMQYLIQLWSCKHLSSVSGGIMFQGLPWKTSFKHLLQRFKVANIQSCSLHEAPTISEKNFRFDPGTGCWFNPGKNSLKHSKLQTWLRKIQVWPGYRMLENFSETAFALSASMLHCRYHSGVFLIYKSTFFGSPFL